VKLDGSTRRSARHETGEKKIRAADCKIGKVTKEKGRHRETGKVKKQNPKSGKILAPGSKVNVKLG
jgi:beta-lactam-binding protein with PASTA domain